MACNPDWRRDGKELFYVAADGRMMAVTVSTSATSRPVEGSSTASKSAR